MKYSARSLHMFFMAMAMTAAPTAGEYRNPCEELGTVETLYSLYYDVPESCEDGKPSFHCSGIFSHGYDAWLGYKGPGVNPSPGKYYFMTDGFENYTLGIESLASAACPTEIIGEYPFWCSSPMAILEGGISFTYFRRDIALPMSDYEEWNQTGVVSYSNKTARPIPLWNGPGIMLVPEMASNPNIDLPAGSRSFWHERVGSSWPHDGGSSSRIDCGNGIDVLAFFLNPKELPHVNVPNDIIMQCPPQTKSFKDYAATPSGWHDYCPKLNTSDEYYEYFKNMVNEVENKLEDGFYSSNSSYTFAAAKAIVDYTPTILTCGVKPADFDRVFIPAASYENWPDIRQGLLYGRDTLLEPNKFETVIRSWHGMGFNQLGKYMVFYADGEEEGSEERALAHATEFYEASQIGGGDPISIPVVFVDQLKLLKDYDAETDPKPNPFGCAVAKSTNVGSSSGSGDNNSETKESAAEVPSKFLTIAVSLLWLLVV